MKASTKKEISLVKVSPHKIPLDLLIIVLAAFPGVTEYITRNLFSFFAHILIPTLNVSKEDFNSLSVTSPGINMLVPIISGFMIDKFGLRFPYHWFAALVILGQAIVTTGLGSSNWSIILFGRTMSSIGGPSLLVAGTIVVAKWFLNNNLSWALGSQMLLTEFGSLLGINFVVWISDVSNSIKFGFEVSLLICCISMISIHYICNWDQQYLSKEVKCNLIERSQDQKLELKDFKKIKFMHGCLIIMIALIQILYHGVLSKSKSIYNKFGLSSGDNNFLSSIIFWTPFILTPLFGLFLDKNGKRMMFMQLTLGIILAFNILIDTIPNEFTPKVVMSLQILIGAVFSFQQAILWSCIAYLTPTKLFGTIYGLSYSILNLTKWSLETAISDQFWVLDKGSLINILIIATLGMSMFLKIQNEVTHVYLNEPCPKNEKFPSLKSSFQFQTT